MDPVIIFCAKYLFAAVVILAAWAWLRVSKKHKLSFAAAVVLAGILAVVMTKISGKLYYDPRPFVTHNLKPLIPHGADNGFPSEHTVFTMTLSMVTYFYSKKLGTAAFVLALLVGIGRVAAHVHSPIDIIGGAIIGVFAGLMGYLLAKTILDKKSAD